MICVTQAVLHQAAALHLMLGLNPIAVLFPQADLLWPSLRA
jgi:hypothetical protein